MLYRLGSEGDTKVVRCAETRYSLANLTTLHLCLSVDQHTGYWSFGWVNSCRSAFQVAEIVLFDACGY